MIKRNISELAIYELQKPSKDVEFEIIKKYLLKRERKLFI